MDDRDPDFLRYLDGQGIGIETELDIVSVEPYGGGIVLRVGGRECVLGPDAARRIRVVEGG